MEIYELVFDFRFKDHICPEGHLEKFGCGQFGMFATRELAFKKMEEKWPEYKDANYHKTESGFQEQWWIQRSGWKDETQTQWEDGNDITASIYKHKVQGID